MMGITSKEIAIYKEGLRLIGESLLRQSNNEAYVLELIRGDELPPLEHAVRDMIEVASFETLL